MCARDRPSAAVDNVWGDDESDTAAEQAVLDREWQTRHQQFYNAGYREGLDEGKVLTMQHGFNAGFTEGAQAGFEYGLVKGALQTLVSLYNGSQEQTAQIEQLLQQIAAVPNKTVMRDTCTALLAQPVDAGVAQQLTAALQQLCLEEGEELPDPSAAVEDLSALASDAAAGAGSSSSSSTQADQALVLQLVAHAKQQLLELGFDVGTAPPIPASATAAAQAVEASAKGEATPQSGQ